MPLQKEDLLAALNSVTSIPVVPFRGGQIDYEAHAKNINYLMENNHLDGDRPRVIGIAGTSLIHHISADEQVRLLGFTGQQMGGRGVLMSGLAPNPVGDAERLIEREAALGDTLRRLLGEAGWEIVNRTPLPVVCTMHAAMRSGAFTAANAVQHLRDEGVLAWAEALRPGEPEAVRLGIISRRTTEDSVRYVVERLSAFAAERD